MRSPHAEALDRASEQEFARSVSPLFESAPRFLARLAAARPFESWDRLFSVARTIAQAMPADEQLELVDAHPRLGAPPDSVSKLSFREQGYDRQASAAGLPAEERAAVELARLNDEYEARFGFRYCVFVGGRSRSVLIPEMAAALGGDREAELRRALDAVVDIAIDRHRQRMEEGPRA